ncbi:MAG TPA: ABC transporter permease [Candidatus Limnocylindria bacterium]|nr:ABC transporter permease [Candidatus Limnocylindria bacterium]
MNDLKFAFRQLLKNPGFTTVAVLTLALGIGANTAIFSVINAVLLKPLPYHEPDRLMVVWADNPSFNLGIHELPPSQQDVLDWRQRAQSFTQVAAVSSVQADLSRNGELTRIGGVSVTANFFPTLGVTPILGRGFTAEEEQPGKDKVVVISDGLWQREFGGDPKVIGTSITLNNESRVVVGIMPAGFNFPRSAEMPPPYNLPVQSELWLPVARDAKFWQDDVNRQFIVISRLKPGVTQARAQAEMDLMAQQAATERPEAHAGWTTHLRPLALQVAGQTRSVLFVLLGAVAFVLLIACVNVASLLLCRSAARRKEMAIRAAIGAGRARVIRQLLTESVLLALLGGGLGLLLGAGSLKLLLALSPPNLPRLHEAAFDGTVFCFALGLTLLTGILFGLVPALHTSKVNLTEALNAAGRGNSDGGRWPSHVGLVTGQVAIAFALLVGAALVIQSFRHMLTLDPGFSKTGVCSFDLTFRGASYEKGASRIALFQQIQERLRAIPGVDSVAMVSHLPLGGSENVSYFFVEGMPQPSPGQEPLGQQRVVTAGYFRTMGVNLVRGRDFDATDTPGKPPVTLINETLARQFFPGADPIGKRIRTKESGENEWATIIGIVRDVRANALELKPTPGFFFPYSQQPTYWEEMTVVVRGNEAALTVPPESALRRELKAVDPALPMANYRTMEAIVSKAVARPRFGSLLLGLFAATALVLTAVGLYGVVAYTVSRRIRELGIRLVLGAQRGDVLRLVLSQGMRPVLVGLGLGLVSAFGLSRFLAALLFEVNPSDPPTFILASALLVGVALLACWLPARRASRVDPVVALRSE